MRTRRIGAVLALAGVLTAGTAGATISAVKSCTTWADNNLVLSRGDGTDVTVTGFGVDLATSVTTTLPGTPLTVVSRKGGTGSNIVLRFSPPMVGGAADGTVTLHYFGGATDVFHVYLLPGPGVTSIAFAPGPGVTTSGGLPRVTSLDAHVVVLKGSNLNSVMLRQLSFDLAGLLDPKIVLQLPGELHISFTSHAGDRLFVQDIFQFDMYTPCGTSIAPFRFAFTVYDPPRTPTPTATPSPSPTPAPLPFRPITPPGGIRPFPTPTPTPGFAPLLPPRR